MRAAPFATPKLQNRMQHVILIVAGVGGPQKAQYCGPPQAKRILVAVSSQRERERRQKHVENAADRWREITGTTKKEPILTRGGLW